MCNLINRKQRVYWLDEPDNEEGEAHSETLSDKDFLDNNSDGS